VAPVALVVWGRLFLPESSHWLVSQGKVEKAEKQLRKLLGRNDVELLAVEIAEEGHIQRSRDWTSLFRGKLQRATILASVPWFLQDISTYGIGIFTPVIIAAAFGASAKEHTVSAVIHNDLLGARGTALVDLGFLVGIACAIALADRWGRIPLQIIGFVGCAVGLILAAAGSLGGQSNLPVIVAGFVLFQFMTNLGPNAQTYLLAGEVFPTPVRGLGAGLAAATGKVGAVLTAFLFPSLLADWGPERLLPLLALTSLAGAAITWAYRIETTGKAMDAI
jgi:MFS family permease